MTDVDRFEAFVRAHQDMVYATAVRLLGRAAEAEDVAQTVFLKAFERFAAIGDSPAAAGWLRTVTRNECLNHLTRYRSRWRLFSELGSRRAGREAERADPADRAVDDSPARQLEQADERQRLDAALRSLPDHQRVPLVLFHFEDASYDEIGALLNISIAKVKSDIHRGREALRARLHAPADRPAAGHAGVDGRDTVPHGSR